MRAPKPTEAELQALADAIRATAARRIALDRKSAKLKAEEVELTKQLLTGLHRLKRDEVVSAKWCARIGYQVVPVVEDEEKLLAWARRKANAEVISVRVLTDPWRALVASGKPVPGVRAFERESLGIVKAAKK